MIKPGLSRRAPPKPPPGRDDGEAETSSRAVLLWLLPAIGWYAVLLTAGGSFGLFSPLAHGLTFNSMLLHLLDGRFDVDPAAIGHEGYLRDGAVYAYFGILPALLRTPFLLLPDFATADFTRLSCLVAVSLMALFKVLTARMVWRTVTAQGTAVLLRFLVLALLFGGPQIQFLRPSIFMESVLWAGAFAAAFVFLVLRGWTREAGFTAGLMSAASLVCGLCLLTRVSTGLGLYAALGLIWLWHLVSEIRRTGPRRLSRQLSALVSPMLVLLAFAALTAFVNQERWGSPLVFVDLSRALILQHFPERLQRLRQYGEFNPIRLGFGLVYYFLPVWVWRDGSGQLLWSDFVERTIDMAELPPSSFFVSDPLIIGLAVLGLFGLVRREVPRRAPITLAAVGLAVPALLMLLALSYTFRYRIEFYPLLELCGFVGFWHLLMRRPRHIEALLGGGAAASVLAAHALWLLNAMSPLGPANRVLGPSGILEFYGSVFH